VDQSDQVKTIAAWTSYHLGDFKAAEGLLARLRSTRDEPGDRALEVNVAIASGNWNELVTFAEREWAKRDERTAHELIRAAQLASYVGSTRARELVSAAAEKGKDSAEILIGCYGIAVSVGWEDSAQVASWLQAAANLSGDDGPVQRMSLQELVERQPAWNRRETEIWEQLSAGALPMFGAAHLLNRSLVSMLLLPALSNLTQSDVRRRAVIFAYSGARSPRIVNADTLALDATALLTFGLLGLTTALMDAFNTIVIPHSTLAWLFNERQRIQFHQPSKIKDAEGIKRFIDSGTLKRFDLSTTPDPNLAAEVGDELAELLAEVDNGLGDDTQRLVVRPYPVHRLGSLMEENADLSAHNNHLCGCMDIVDALVRRGRLTAAEELRARSYLSLNEKPWSHFTVIADNALLFLDDLAISYFQHLGLIPNIRAAGFRVYIAERESSEYSALIQYASLAADVTELLDNLQRDLAYGITTNKVRVSTLRRGSESDDEDDAAFRHHPSTTILYAAPLVDAIVVDDRSINQHLSVTAESIQKPLLTSLDVLDILHRKGKIDNHARLEHVTRLRRAGFALVAVEAAELSSLIAAATTHEGKLVESAELKAIRESILRIRMSDILQLPKEHVWLAGLSDACSHALRAQWRDDIPDDDARARSNWLLEILDLRGWMHRLPGSPSEEDGRKGRLRVVQLMMRLDKQPRTVKRRYWTWLEERLLKPIKDEEPEAYAWIVSHAGALIEGAVTNGLNAQGGDGRD
jgi:hypothetical protein